MKRIEDFKYPDVIHVRNKHEHDRVSKYYKLTSYNEQYHWYLINPGEGFSKTPYEGDSKDGTPYINHEFENIIFPDTKWYDNLKVGDCMVCIQSYLPHNKTNYVYKISRISDKRYLKYIDSYMLDLKGSRLNNWRKATDSETELYRQAGKPIEILTETPIKSNKWWNTLKEGSHVVVETVSNEKGHNCNGVDKYTNLVNHVCKIKGNQSGCRGDDKTWKYVRLEGLPHGISTNNIRKASVDERIKYESTGKPYLLTDQNEVYNKYNPQFNNWYNSGESFLIYYEHDNGTNYGFNHNGEWSSVLGIAYKENWKPTSKDEVWNRIIEYAKKEYPIGTFHHGYNSIQTYVVDNYKINNNFLMGGAMGCLFHMDKKQWAKKTINPSRVYHPKPELSHDMKSEPIHKGDYVKYLGTKTQGNSTKSNSWEAYFGSQGVIRGDVGIATQGGHGQSIFVKDNIRKHSNGSLNRSDLEKITKEEYERACSISFRNAFKTGVAPDNNMFGIDPIFPSWTGTRETPKKEESYFDTDDLSLEELINLNK